MPSRFVLAVTVALLLTFATGRATPAPIAVTLPTESPSGVAVNDRIPVEYFPAEANGPAPAVVILHLLGERKMHSWRAFGRYLAHYGIGAAVIVLPYHMQRTPRGEPGGGRFISPNAAVAAQAYEQAISDTSATAAWLAKQPGVDPERIGVVGVSLGAIIAHTAMGRDSRLSAGVAFLGGGNLLGIRRRSLLFRIFPAAVASGAAERLAAVDPLTYAGRNRPRRVLMVQAARDELVPPRYARELWKALGRPPIRWVDANHFALSWSPAEAMRASRDYLLSVWTPGARPVLPPVRVATVTAGLAWGLDSIVAPTVQWQALSLGRKRDHTAAYHLDLGISTRGGFVELAAALGRHVDIGLARRLGGTSVRPVLTLKETF